MSTWTNKPDSHVAFWRAAGLNPGVFTYIIKCDGSDLLKIGKSKSPDWRLVNLQVGCPFELSILWCWPIDIESELHQCFSQFNVIGEWFRISESQAIAAAAVISKEKERGLI